jgi:glycosyltransferase 2 family protein
MNKKIVLAFKLIITSLLLTYIFFKIPFNKIIITLSSVNPILFFSSVFLVLIVLFLSCEQTKYLTKIQKIFISYSELVKIYFTTAFYSLFLPGAVSGGAVKWYKFAKYGSKSSAAAVVLFNRYLETFIVAILGILYSIPTLIKSHLGYLLWVWTAVLILLLLSYYLLINDKVFKRISKGLIKFPMPSFVKKRAIRLLDAIGEFQNITLKDHFEILGIMLTYHVIDILSFYLVAQSINVTVNFFVLGWIASVVTLSSLAPISYAGLGLREGILVYILRYYGVSPHEALVISFLAFTKDLSVPIIGGILELKEFLLGKSYKSIEETNG